MAWFRRIISPGGLTAALALIPPLILAGLVAGYAVDVPYFDQWSFSYLSAHYLTGGRDLSLLLAQHTEARMLFPALLNLACQYLANGDLRACAVAALLLAALSLYNIHRLAARTLPGSAGTRLAVTVLASMMIFSPVQWENWLWSNQLALFFPVACLTSAISIAYSELRIGPKIGIAAALAFVATFSFPNGILCWVVLPLLLVGQPSTGKGKLLAMAAWLAAAAGSLWLFFSGYQTMAGHAAWQDSFQKPLILLFSFMGFLGAPLSSGGEIWLYRSGRLVSLGLLSLLSAACVALWLSRSRALLARSAGWLALCAFVLGSAAVTAMGRSTMGSVFLHDSRYTSFSVCLVIGLAGLLAVVTSEWTGTRRGVAVLTGGALFTVILGLHLSASMQALPPMREWRTARLQSKACLVLINAVDSPCTATKLGPAATHVRAVAGTLNNLHLLTPAPLPTAQLPANLIAAAPLDAVRGKFVSLRRLADGSWIATGYAVLPGREEPADGVVITYDDVKGERQIAGLADTPTRIDGSELRSAWTKWFVLPDGATLVRAFAYDALAGRFYPLTPAQTAAGTEVSPVRFGTENNGAFDRIGRGFANIPDPGEPMMAFGWAFLRDQARVPDAILVTCGEEQRIVGSGEAHMARADVVRAFGNDPRTLHSGFGALIDEKRLPAGGCPLRAWGYDATRHAAQPLEHTQDSRQLAPR